MNLRCRIGREDCAKCVVVPADGIGIRAWGAADYLAANGYRIIVPWATNGASEAQ